MENASAVGLAVSVGAHVKAVQRMVGHPNPMALGTYAGPLDEDVHDVADRLTRRSNLLRTTAETLASVTP
ncbi:hypothetical protein MMAD_44720 [Mycolicibacterium madagascariense]|uniref:Integrase n=1 Tax=Mycolicibacterium madagascariense TaxID=212765 RepID=A0A7I7XLT5_9MYCO|nr:hypothetical protein MMAD_44720 [Mycolicibacterium madagascariense]